MPREKPLDVRRLWRDLDRPQDIEVAALKIKKRGIPPPKDQEAMERALHRLGKKARKEREIASRTVPLEELVEEPSVPDPSEAWLSLHSYRELLAELDARRATVVDAMIRLGMRHREIALMAGISEKQVKRAREVAINFLRAKLT